MQSHERRRQLEVDVIRACDHHCVLELVAVLEELPQAPRSVFELGRREFVVGVQPFDDGEADFSFVELGWERHGKHFSAVLHAPLIPRS